MSLFSKATTPVTNTPNRPSATMISQGCKITGQLDLDCDILIDGTVTGNIRTERTATINQSGHVTGDIFATKLIIKGKAEGTFYATYVEILQAGYVQGVIHSDDLSIEQGGRFVGETRPFKQTAESDITPLLAASAK